MLATPPPKIGKQISTNRRNKSADRFFSKTGSRCPGSQSQAPNTPSFWLLCSWSHVESQNMYQLSKKIHPQVFTWSLSSSQPDAVNTLVVLLNVSNPLVVFQFPFRHFLSPVLLSCSPAVVNLLGNSFFHAPTNPATRRQLHTGLPLKHCWPSIF